jgi:sugar/nucleoside kinase (ribokinase family)
MKKRTPTPKMTEWEESVQTSDERVILVIGACALDRLLVVNCYPEPDAKVRTTSYVEVGGGNAANTAVALARLSSAAFASSALQSTRKDTLERSASSPVRVKLLTKIGTDSIGDTCHNELLDSGVDLSSPLYIRPPDTTTAVTTVIVSEMEHTRTCLHTPGTCGILEPSDFQGHDTEFLDDVFENVVHVHSDMRHTELALLVAKEATHRGIPVSLDAEKDRGGKAMEELLDLASVVITNNAQLTIYLDRVNPDGEVRGNSKTPATYARATRLCHYFRQRNIYNEIVTTLGEYGSLHMQHINTLTLPLPSDEQEGEQDCGEKSIQYHAQNQTMEVRTVLHVNINDRQAAHTDDSGSDIGISPSTKTVIQQDIYKIHRVGTLKNVEIVDSTGAGDCFVAGYILSVTPQRQQDSHPQRSTSNGALSEVHVNERGLLQSSSLSLTNTNISNLDFAVEMGLMLGSWVAGKKLGGLGARAALPSGDDVNRALGVDDITVWQCLRTLLTKPTNPPP